MDKRGGVSKRQAGWPRDDGPGDSGKAELRGDYPATCGLQNGRHFRVVLPSGCHFPVLRQRVCLCGKNALANASDL